MISKLSNKEIRLLVMSTKDPYELAIAVEYEMLNRLQLKESRKLDISKHTPVEGQAIVGYNAKGNSWREFFDPSEPLGTMTHWSPL